MPIEILISRIKAVGYADVQRIQEDKDGKGWLFTGKIIGANGVLGPRAVHFVSRDQVEPVEALAS